MYVSPYTKIFDLIRSGDHQALRGLLATDAALVEAKDARGSSPLVLATYLGDVAATEILLDHGAEINPVSGSGNALMGAAFRGHVDVVKLLLERGADVSIKHPATGQTAVEFAQMGNQAEIVQLLQD